MGPDRPGLWLSLPRERPAAAPTGWGWPAYSAHNEENPHHWTRPCVVEQTRGASGPSPMNASRGRTSPLDIRMPRWAAVDHEPSHTGDDRACPKLAGPR